MTKVWILAISCDKSVIMMDVFASKDIAMQWLWNSGHLDSITLAERTQLISFLTNKNCKEYSYYPNWNRMAGTVEKHIRLAEREIAHACQNS